MSNLPKNIYPAIPAFKNSSYTLRLQMFEGFVAPDAIVVEIWDRNKKKYDVTGSFVDNQLLATFTADQLQKMGAIVEFYIRFDFNDERESIYRFGGQIKPTLNPGDDGSLGYSVGADYYVVEVLGLDVINGQTEVATTAAAIAVDKATEATLGAVTATEKAQEAVVSAEQTVVAKTDAETAATAAIVAKDTAVVKATEATSGAAVVVQKAAEVAVAQAEVDTNKTEAVTAATNAKDSETAAAQYAAAASVNINDIYDTPQEGLDASIDGATYLVKGSGDVAYYVYKRINVSTYEFVWAMPSVLLVQALSDAIKPDVSNGSFVVVDEDNYKIFEVTNQGTINWYGRAQELATVSDVKAKTDPVIVTLEEEDFVITDEDGGIIFRAGINGVDYVGKSTGGSGGGDIPDLTLPSDILHLIKYGQSLSVNGTQAGSTNFYDTITFPGGVQQSYNPTDTAARNAYYGSAFIPVPVNGADTGKAEALIFKNLLRDENDLAITDQDFTILVSSAGDGGQSWTNLSSTTGQFYVRLIESVKYGQDFAIASGKTYQVGSIVYMQGENTGDRDDTESEWYTKLETLFNSLNTDIKAITGQTKDVQFITYQIASSMTSGLGVPLAQLKLAREKTNVHFGAAMYMCSYIDTLHISNEWYRIVDAMMGVVQKRAIADGTKQEPIYPTSWFVNKNQAGTQWIISLQMNVPVKPLVFDANRTYTTAVTHEGFIIKNGSNVDIVTGATISRGDTIKITCSQNPVGLSLTYAIEGRTSGGHLRDSQGDNITVPVEGVQKRVDNWCPIFQITI